MEIDGDLVVLLFILVLLILTFKKTPRFAGYNVDVRTSLKAPKPKLPNYPGVSKKILIAFVKASEVAHTPPTIPTLPSAFSPTEAGRIVQHALQRLRTVSPSLKFSTIGLDSATLEKDADGVQYWSVATMLYERTHTTTMKVVIDALVMSTDGRIYVQTIAPETKPLPLASTLMGSGSRYATYTLPIPSI